MSALNHASIVLPLTQIANKILGCHCFLLDAADMLDKLLSEDFPIGHPLRAVMEA